tara:strand:+ start:230 stop:478 length:249 start_codon:yes stop_codon:yes gene_type:complete
MPLGCGRDRRRLLEIWGHTSRSIVGLFHSMRRFVDAPLGEQLSDSAEREREADAELDRVHDDRRRKAIAFKRYRLHHPSLAS